MPPRLSQRQDESVYSLLVCGLLNTTPCESILGNVYNVTDAFTIPPIVEGDGNKYPRAPIGVSRDAYKYDVLAGFVDLSGYVEKEAGKGLSDENFTAALKDKLDGIAAGANKYVHPTHTAAASGLVQDHCGC